MREIDSTGLCAFWEDERLFFCVSECDKIVVIEKLYLYYNINML